ncbi:hypothetical protein ABT144_09190 [Streptomyces sp. NPDC002039]|uniref:hypothetical protein n=1 Tax=unclassified Streptomyces TaxID=2593676 RepID=UPI0033244919
MCDEAGGLRAALERTRAERDAALREVALLRAEVDSLKRPAYDPESRWSRIDHLVREGRRIQALRRIGEEFDCGDRQAAHLLDNRVRRLRETDPEDFAEGPDA